LLFIVIAPLIGLIISCVLMLGTSWLFYRCDGPRTERWFRHAQLISSAFMSIAHGGNDAQKTAGIMTSILFTSGLIKTFEVPQGIMIAAYCAMGLGTLAGGRRIITTMGRRLTHLQPQGGFCAEAAAACSIFIATYLKLPISTTHVITGAITGVGAIVRIKAVRWNVATRIVWAWVFTLPASAAFGWLAVTLLRLALPSYV
jgi:PiT family inorganic phosphate transporter